MGFVSSAPPATSFPCPGLALLFDQEQGCPTSHKQRRILGCALSCAFSPLGTGVFSQCFLAGSGYLLPPHLVGPSLISKALPGLHDETLPPWANRFH